MARMADLKKVDNFERAGIIWMRILTVMGLTCLVRQKETIRVSRWKLAYCILILCAALSLTYLRIRAHHFDRQKAVKSYVHFLTVCNSLCSSALMIGLTIISQRGDAAFLTKMMRLRKRYSIPGYTSTWSYFPPSCFLPCVTIIAENVYFVIASSASISPLILTSYFFSIYNYILYGSLQLYLSVIENGFLQLNHNLQELEMLTMTGNPVNLQMRALQELRGLRSKYHDLFDFFCRARGILTKRIILIIGYNFVNCVLFTFYGFVDGLKTTWRLTLVSEWVTAFFWASCCFFGLYVLIPPFERIFRQAHSIAVAVQSLGTRPGYSSNFYSELRLFSTQLVLEDVGFAPDHFLTINNRMLLSAMGAIASSLAILLQMTQG